MPISRAEVEHVALLGRLALSEEEKERLAYEMNRVLQAFEELQKLDTSDVPPTSHVIEMTNVMRPDRARPSMPREDVLANAPDRTEHFVRVPRIVEE
jgi:aspartyl-tRNA(Asn)/glutamyl-tRNA(Gln) amidotransferase subunit C